ncbi:MAG: hypothetical protein ACYTEQ_17495 [Planctomycetota bacterium]|jgi:hypothetical protein
MFKKMVYFTTLIVLAGLVSSAAADVVAQWKFDETEGSTAYDLVDGFDLRIPKKLIARAAA